MRVNSSLQDLIHAGRVLFGPAFAPERGWQVELKRVYRRRAMESHPDRAVQLGRDAAELEVEFRAVTHAYRVLSTVPPDAAPRWRRPAAAGHGDADAPEQVIPRRRLRFAEYLYHQGRVPRQSLVEALVWQRAQRPAVGRIAVDFGFLRQEDVRDLLSHRGAQRSWHVPFAEFAVREGMLTGFQRMAALGRQRRLQQPIGQFFVEQGFITEEEIQDIRRRLILHNARMG